MDAADRPSGVRLAELVAALSLATDLGLGQPQEHVLRQTVIARRLAAAAGWPEQQQTAVFYVSLLAWVGCVSDSHELAAWFGDDLRLRADSYEVDKVGVPKVRFVLGHVGEGSGSARRLTMIGRFLTAGPGRITRSMLGHCQTTGDIAGRLGLGDQVGRALQQAFERWDGKGVPGLFSGQRIDPAMRVVQITDDAEVFHRVHGVDAASEMLRSRRATEFDPALVDLFCRRAAELLDGLDEIDAWDAVISADADLGPELSEAAFTQALRVFGDYADLKSPSWLGHSVGVATLAAAAASRLGLPPGEVTLVERAALVHDLGAIGVSAGLWGKPGPLSAADKERVRMHPYLTERILARPARLAEIGALAALHHERIDGSGYPHGIRGDDLSLPARVIAASDAYHARCEDRPHRGAFSAASAASALQSEVAAGRLDGEAANAVLAAAGHRIRRRPALPRDLTRREVEMTLKIGDTAPDFEAETSGGRIRFHDWVGDKWAVLFSHPKDFTPVCTTELGYMAKIKPEFDRRDVKIIGLSVDPVDSHTRWEADIEATQGAALNYPLIADSDFAVSKLYGMLPASTSGDPLGRSPADNQTVRNVFVIGPDKTIKLIMVYPMTTGRNFDEVLRVVDSLQLTARHKVSTPVNWRQGEDVIIAGSVSDEEAKRMYPQGWKAPRPYIRIVPQPS